MACRSLSFCGPNSQASTSCLWPDARMKCTPQASALSFLTLWTCRSWLTLCERTPSQTETPHAWPGSPSDRPFVVAQWPGLEPVRCRWKHRTGSMFLLDRVIHVSGDSARDDHALAGRGARLALVTSSPLDSVSRDLFRYACQRRL